MRKEAAQEWRITMKKVDLHVHSTYSDGTNTPKELIKLAENEGLGAIALTTTILLMVYQMPLMQLKTALSN